MLCPVCEITLSEIPVEDFFVLACKGGCGGLWFESGTLQDVDDMDEDAGEALLEIQRDAKKDIDKSMRLSCPRCEGITMHRHRHGPFSSVEIDECPQCAGIWLNAGSLASLRSDFDSTADRDKCEDSFMAASFASSSHLHSERRRTRRFSAVARFIGHMWHDYGAAHFRGRDWPPWRGGFKDR